MIRTFGEFLRSLRSSTRPQSDERRSVCFACRSQKQCRYRRRASKRCSSEEPTCPLGSRALSISLSPPSARARSKRERISTRSMLIVPVVVRQRSRCAARHQSGRHATRALCPCAVTHDLDVRRGRSTDGGPVDSLEPVARQPLDPAWRQVHVHEQLHGWRSGTSTSSARQAA